MTKPSLKTALESGQFVAAPGVHDMITAKIANKVGFDFVFASGYWMSASAYGLPDAGIATYTQMLDRVATLVESCDAGVIADADTGYGGLLNVHRTVRGYEQVGVSAIQLEDQEFPKKCGHTPNKRVVAQEDMVQKIQVACDARQSEETLIIARTDAKQPYGFDAALERCHAYAEAGADIIFFEAPQSEDEMRRACGAIDKPMLANMATGGVTPILPVDQLKDIGYSIALFPALAALAAAAAAEKALLALKQTGDSESGDVDCFSFEEFNHLIGFPEVWAFDKKWAVAPE
ncbi:MAG: isocitrate lyase/PEP mutase family protein [Pseudomonadota bacterium]